MGSTKLVSPEAFRELIGRRARELLELAAFAATGGPRCFGRPLLGDLLSEATKLEELLDAYGVRQNRRWHPLRQAAAALKLFSNVSYILQHMLHFLPTYRLLPLEADFVSATRQALEFTCRILSSTARGLLALARELGLPPVQAPAAERFADELPDGRLPPDRGGHPAVSAGETVAYLATAFLNLAEEARFLHVAQERPPVVALLPDPIREERLRSLEQKFHNLQSVYDTRISDSEAESLDPRLPVLRGHISVTYHLLETSTAFAHYYERHLLGQPPQGPGEEPLGEEGGRLLEVLVGYSLAFASRYTLSARSLCHEMLRSYAVPDRILVPVPRYRGFHVRPSTLVARIVTHYGSEVVMELEGELYNAGVTLDLFRANERINARKKRNLAEEVQRLLAGGELPPAASGLQEELARGVVQRLFARGRLLLYEREVAPEQLRPRDGESLQEYAVRVLHELFLAGKIDVVVELSAAFAGDRRVLEDIRLLAECGYGEDDFGNNLALPPALEYLRK